MSLSDPRNPPNPVDPIDAAAGGERAANARRIDRRVLIAVEAALDLPVGDRRSFLEGCESLDAALRADAAALLGECERVEQSDVAGVGAPNADLISIDLPHLLSQIEPDAYGLHRLQGGSQLGCYRITRFVAAGGMGEVYEAVDTRVDRRVAIKTLPAFVRPERAERFAREAVMMARLEHPSIARLYEWSSGDVTAQTPPYIAMEFVDGVSLRDRVAAIRARGGDAAEIIELLLPVVDAVAHAHARGVLHRDIKPSNILVDAKGSPRLLDFGVAAIIDGDAQAVYTMTEGATPGTLTYMSPEHVRGGSARVTTRSDVYGLGLVLYEMLSGRPAVEAKSRGIVEVIDAVVRIDPTPLRACASGVSADLDFVVRKALRKDPESRYPTADALAEDLRRILRGDAPLGRDVGMIELLRGLAWRHRRHTAIAAAVLLGIGTGVAFSAVQFIRAREAEARADVIVGQLLEGSKPLIADLHRRLLQEDQPLSARRAALEATVNYLEWLLGNAPQDDRVRIEVARRYRALAVVAGSAGDNSLGDSAAASNCYLRSLSIMDEILGGGAGHGQGRSLDAQIERELLLDRSSVLREYAGLLDFEQRAPFFARANADQRAALALMPEGAERIKAERFLLFTEIQHARLEEDPGGFEEPIAGLRRIASRPDQAKDPELFSEIGLGERYWADVLEKHGQVGAAVAHARAAQGALEHSIALGQDEFTNRRHLARVELLIASRTCAERPPEASLALLLAALERSQGATNLKPTNSFYRHSHLECLVLFAGAARVVAEHAREQGDAAAASAVVARSIAAIDEHLAFTLALPTEGAPHRGEPKWLGDLDAARGALTRQVDGRPEGN
jgi:hypothetical protein